MHVKSKVKLKNFSKTQLEFSFFRGNIHILTKRGTTKQVAVSILNKYYGLNEFFEPIVGIIESTFPREPDTDHPRVRVRWSNPDEIMPKGYTNVFSTHNLEEVV